MSSSSNDQSLLTVESSDSSGALAIITDGLDQRQLRLRPPTLGPVVFRPEDIIVMATLDGKLHGIHKPSGRTLWSVLDPWGSLVSVAENPHDNMLIDTEHGPPAAGSLPGDHMPPGFGPGGARLESSFGQDGLIIPEPSGDGNLYHLLHGNPIQKLPFSIKQAVGWPSFSDGRVAYTSKKLSHLLVLDPLTGQAVRQFGDSDGDSILMDSDLLQSQPILISRTEYILTITDVKTKKVKWNITYGEFAPASFPLDLLTLDTDDSIISRGNNVEANPNIIKISSSASGEVTIVQGDNDEDPWVIEFDYPAISAFDVGAVNRAGHHVTQVFPELPEQQRPGWWTNRRDHNNHGGPQTVVVGAINNTVYLLSKENSQISGDVDAIELVSDDMEEESYEESNSIRYPRMHHTYIGGALREDSKSVSVVSGANACLPGYPRYPRCLTGVYNLSPPMPSSSPKASRKSQSLTQQSQRMVERFLAFYQHIGVFGGTIMALLFGGLIFVLSMRWFGLQKALLSSSENQSSELSQLGSVAGGGRGKADNDQPLPPKMADQALSASAQDSTNNKSCSGSECASVPSNPGSSKKKKKRAKISNSSRESTHAEKNDDAVSSETEEDLVGKVKSTQNGILDDATRSSSELELKAISVSDTVLGHGSHGTVVFKGIFGEREVAVKRLLLDFYDVARHEVKILRESDHHPNVIRYFYQEKTERFMYIALELCPSSLYDVVENQMSQLHAELRTRLNPKHTISQIIAGLQHLHSLNIVHRDIKPQNILVADTPPHASHPRILISDFGLCKRLAEDQSSFHNTANTLGGTAGWRAPEIMAAFQHQQRQQHDQVFYSSSSSSPESSNSDASNWIVLSTTTSIRITRAIDIFSTGCVAYYILTMGKHPFGDRFTREINIIKGNHRLELLDTFLDGGIEAKDLVKRMIAKDPKKRPDANNVSRHPYFWGPAEKLSFLQDVSDRVESEPRDPPSEHLKQLESGAHNVVGADWLRKFDRILVEDMRKYRFYDGTLARDLLRVLRNSKHHYRDLPPAAQKALGEIPDVFLSYFTDRFPYLLMHVYNFVDSNSLLSSETLFRGYFEPARAHQ